MTTRPVTLVYAMRGQEAEVRIQVKTNATSWEALNDIGEALASKPLVYLYYEDEGETP